MICLEDSEYRLAKLLCDAVGNEDVGWEMYWSHINKSKGVISHRHPVYNILNRN